MFGWIVWFDGVVVVDVVVYVIGVIGIIDVNGYFQIEVGVGVVLKVQVVDGWICCLLFVFVGVGGIVQGYIVFGMLVCLGVFFGMIVVDVVW